ncbi:MAG: hypothetical protein ACJAYF_003339 [Arenicella sp.]|jgi:hypothetical protein
MSDAYQGLAAPDAVVTAEFVGGVNFPSEVDHKVDLYANSQLLGSLEWWCRDGRNSTINVNEWGQ